MESYDSQMARRVWQRVQPSGETVGALLASEAECVAICRRLSGLLPNRKLLLRQMADQCRQHIRCLKGIGYMTTGQRPAELPLDPRQERLDGLLRGCYLQCLKSLREYTRRSEEEEYGPIFRALAKQKQAHCFLLAEILGSET